jgi:Putative Flp pilus-assembly TadE/G-like
MRPVRAERGQVAVLALGLALLAFAVAGVAVDGTRAWLARRALQNAADSSALAAASELDRELLYSGSGRALALDPAAARAVAEEWLARRRIGARSRIVTGESSVVIELRQDIPTTFLGLVGIRAIPVAAVATARPIDPARLAVSGAAPQLPARRGSRGAAARGAA